MIFWLRILLLACLAGTAPLMARGQAVPVFEAADIAAAHDNALGALRAGDTPPAIDRVKAYLGAIQGYEYDAYLLGSLSPDWTYKHAEQFYAEARRIAPPDMLATVDSVMGSYLNATYRTGRAEELFRSALADPAFVRDPVNEFVTLLPIMAAYLDKGQPSNAERILERAKAAITRMPQNKRADHRLSLMRMEMALRIAQENPGAVRVLWDQAKEVLKSRDLEKSKRGSAALSAIYYLNQVGDSGRAKEAERIARDNADGVAPPKGLPKHIMKELANLVITCHLILYSGDAVALARDPNYGEKFDECSDGEFQMPLMQQGQMPIAPARVFELKGDDNRALTLYRAAIKQAEKARGTFETGQRSEFFSGRWRPAYSGILRIEARRAASSPTAYHSFTMAMIASEQSRARQFGDLTGGNAAFTESKEMLDFLTGLPEGTAVVVQTSQDQELVVMGFRAGKYSASVLPISANHLDRQISEVMALVSNPSSDVVAVERSLDALSRDTLGATRALLHGAKRVIVLTDGALTRVPFGLFTTTDGGDPLALSADVTYALSLRSLRSPTVASNAAGFFGAGDPAFPTVQFTTGLTQPRPASAATSSGLMQPVGEPAAFAPLPLSRREVVDIAATFDEKARLGLASLEATEFVGTTTRVALGQRATETQAKLALPKARYLHLATHGLIAGELGLPESAVVLAASSEDDGYLTASEVEKLKIAAALTVLSACNTGAGRVVAGEGVLGLARSFLLAGSQSSLVSLWSVNDASTADFMIDFYKRLQAGKSPAVALRETSIEMRGLYDHPAHWAAFILISR